MPNSPTGTARESTGRHPHSALVAPRSRANVRTTPRTPFEPGQPDRLLLDQHRGGRTQTIGREVGARVRRRARTSRPGIPGTGVRRGARRSATSPAMDPPRSVRSHAYHAGAGRGHRPDDCGRTHRQVRRQDRLTYGAVAMTSGPSVMIECYPSTPPSGGRASHGGPWRAHRAAPGILYPCRSPCPQAPQ